MKRDDIAFQIFLKRLQAGYATDKDLAAVTSQAKFAYQLADLFLAERAEQNPGQLKPGQYIASVVDNS